MIGPWNRVALTLQTGTRLDHSEILAPLGAGGMGEVYRARDVTLRREVAVKLLLDGVADDPDRLARFERNVEAFAAAATAYTTGPGFGAVQEALGAVHTCRSSLWTSWQVSPAMG